jgi:hypothetical protein
MSHGEKKKALSTGGKMGENGRMNEKLKSNPQCPQTYPQTIDHVDNYEE